MGFYPIEGLEEWVDVGVIGFLGSGETAFVDAVVDCVVDCVLYVSKEDVLELFFYYSPQSFISSISFRKCSG